MGHDAPTSSCGPRLSSLVDRSCRLHRRRSGSLGRDLHRAARNRVHPRRDGGGSNAFARSRRGRGRPRKTLSVKFAGAQPWTRACGRSDRCFVKWMVTTTRGSEVRCERIRAGSAPAALAVGRGKLRRRQFEPALARSSARSGATTRTAPAAPPGIAADARAGAPPSAAPTRHARAPRSAGIGRTGRVAARPVEGGEHEVPLVMPGSGRCRCGSRVLTLGPHDAAADRRREPAGGCTARQRRTPASVVSPPPPERAGPAGLRGLHADPDYVEILIGVGSRYFFRKYLPCIKRLGGNVGVLRAEERDRARMRSPRKTAPLPSRAGPRAATRAPRS